MPLINYKENTITKAIITNTILIGLTAVSSITIHDLIEEDMPHIDRTSRYILTFVLTCVLGLIFFIIMWLVVGFGEGMIA